MTSLVEILRKTWWETWWEKRGKVSTFLTRMMLGVFTRWETFSFARVLHGIYTAISTMILVGFTDSKCDDFHFYTEPITTITN